MIITYMHAIQPVATVVHVLTSLCNYMHASHAIYVAITLIMWLAVVTPVLVTV